MFAEVADMNLVLQWDRGTRAYLTLGDRWKGQVSGTGARGHKTRPSVNIKTIFIARNNVHKCNKVIKQPASTRTRLIDVPRNAPCRM